MRGSLLLERFDSRGLPGLSIDEWTLSLLVENPRLTASGGPDYQLSLLELGEIVHTTDFRLYHQMGIEVIEMVPKDPDR